MMMPLPMPVPSVMTTAHFDPRAAPAMYSPYAAALASFSMYTGHGKAASMFAFSAQSW